MGVPNAVRHLWRHPARKKNQTKKQKTRGSLCPKNGARKCLAGELGKAFGAMISVLDRSLDSVSNDWLMVTFGHNQLIVTNPYLSPKRFQKSLLRKLEHIPNDV